tara:strand:- start:1364 stop:2227 length:864 start_codon:yes stop_codon:yes gene_type:complete
MLPGRSRTRGRRLGNSLQYSLFASDADAAAYIALLRGDGVSVSGAQQTAINDFFVSGKDEGWYSDLKRVYLPIWAAAGPNARCLVSGTSGTFNGSMTHGSGFVTGDGSSSYFDVGATPSAMGIATGDAFILRGIHASPATALHIACGVEQTSASQSLAMLNFGNTHGSAGVTYFRQSTSPGEALFTGQGTEYRGIYIGSCTATNSRFIIRRRSGGTSVGTSGVSSTEAIKDLNPYFMGRNRDGTLNSPSNGSEFAWALGTGMTQAQATDFTTALETMWETCTGLTLF